MVGRKEEIAILESLKNTNKSAFVAVYGRRRVGKTFLIRQVFEDKFTFQLTGIANITTRQQLTHFHTGMIRHFPAYENKPVPKDWFQAFQNFITALELDKSNQKTIFLDELPWFDTPHSDFIPAFEHFWNGWASARKDILLLVCGSAAAWIVNNLINNKGGLHNRVTHRLKLDPFTLSECADFFESQSIALDRYQLIQLYMAFGGIPFYLEAIDPRKSATQNINDLCFTPKGIFRIEFENLYTSLFKNADKYIRVIEALAQKSKGLERDELLKLANLSDGGGSTKILKELEESSFIKRYNAVGKNTRNSLYQLTDFYSLFYLKFIKNSSDLDKNHWINSLDSPEVRAWSGYAFELVCLCHLDNIKQALGISGVQTLSSAWVGSYEGQKAQIDLIIDRRDHVINLCEMKFSINEFSIDKKYADELRSKIGIFRQSMSTKKALFLTFITTFGLTPNSYSQTLVQNALTMDIFFD